MSLSDLILKHENNKKVKKLSKLADKVLVLADTYKAMSDDELKSQTDLFKKRLAEGETLDDILPEAFATVREASTRVLGLTPYPVQVMGAIALHQGRIAEMQTGEGKTLVATMPAYLNALAGKGVHIVTVNDYLAQRDANWMGGIHRFLGLTVGVITHEKDSRQKKEAYNCDITYATNNEIGFDYLRDNMTVSAKDCMQRGHFFAIVDEVDSILIDDARNPLIISQPQEGIDKEAVEANRFIKGRIREGHYEMDEKETTISLTESGLALAEAYFKTADFSTLEGSKLLGKINAALKAHYLFHRDQEYIVENGEVVIVDENTGRKMKGRRYSEGLHEAIEAKEGILTRNGSKTCATTSFQNYFRIYKKLSGMTGTALTEEGEFRGIYNLDVVPIPPNLPSSRVDEPDKIFTTKEVKYRAVVDDITDCYHRGQPVLVGTTTIENSEIISNMLFKARIPHNVLNAKQHQQEAYIIAQAGKSGSVTISTNMAGRGTDIMLGGNPEFPARAQLVKEGFTEETILASEMRITNMTPEQQKAHDRYQELIKEYSQQTQADKEKVIALGGLRVIGTERHESRRIDNQLRGRSGRQGDVGSSCFYIATEDDLFRKFGGEGLINLMQRLIGLQEGEVIQMPLLAKQLENAQKRCEENNFAIRKRTIEYDDVIDKQRKLLYEQRNTILRGENVHEQILKFIGVFVDKIVHETVDFGDIEDETDVDYVQINTKIMNTILHHLPTPEEIELIKKYRGKPFVLSDHILEDTIKDDEEITAENLADAEESLLVDENAEEEILYQEVTSSTGQTIKIDVSKLFINPNIIKRRDMPYLEDYVYGAAVIQYCQRIRAYNSAVLSQMQSLDEDRTKVKDTETDTDSADYTQEVIKNYEMEIQKGTDYQVAIEALRKKLIASSAEHWMTFTEIEQQILLTIVNRHWMDHIDDMDALRRGIGLRGYAHRDPIMEYRQEAGSMFDDMAYKIQVDTAYTLLKNNNFERYLEAESNKINSILRGFTFVKNDSSSKVGRNDPCPCGSGRKYKNCCGKTEV